MVFGFSKGKIDIKLENFDFFPGDVVKGTLVLDLKKAVKAKNLKVILLGRERVRRGAGSSSSGSSVQTETVFELDKMLDGEKEYQPSKPPQEYSFELEVPTDIFEREAEVNKGKLGKVFGAVSRMGEIRYGIKWYIRGRLVIPWAIDIKKTIQINISQKKEE